jgi:hypothetical protein
MPTILAQLVSTTFVAQVAAEEPPPQKKLPPGGRPRLPVKYYTFPDQKILGRIKTVTQEQKQIEPLKAMQTFLTKVPRKHIDIDLYIDSSGSRMVYAPLMLAYLVRLMDLIENHAQGALRIGLHAFEDGRTKQLLDFTPMDQAGKAALLEAFMHIRFGVGLGKETIYAAVENGTKRLAALPSKDRARLTMVLTDSEADVTPRDLVAETAARDAGIWPLVIRNFERSLRGNAEGARVSWTDITDQLTRLFTRYILVRKGATQLEAWAGESPHFLFRLAATNLLRAHVAPEDRVLMVLKDPSFADALEALPRELKREFTEFFPPRCEHGKSPCQIQVGSPHLGLAVLKEQGTRLAHRRLLEAVIHVYARHRGDWQDKLGGYLRDTYVQRAMSSFLRRVPFHTVDAVAVIFSHHPTLFVPTDLHDENYYNARPFLQAVLSPPFTKIANEIVRRIDALCASSPEQAMAWMQVFAFIPEVRTASLLHPHLRAWADAGLNAKAPQENMVPRIPAHQREAMVFILQQQLFSLEYRKRILTDIMTRYGAKNAESKSIINNLPPPLLEYVVEKIFTDVKHGGWGRIFTKAAMAMQRLTPMRRRALRLRLEIHNHLHPEATLYLRVDGMAERREWTRLLIFAEQGQMLPHHGGYARPSQIIHDRIRQAMTQWTAVEYRALLEHFLQETALTRKAQRTLRNWTAKNFLERHPKECALDFGDRIREPSADLRTRRTLLRLALSHFDPLVENDLALLKRWAWNPEHPLERLVIQRFNEYAAKRDAGGAIDANFHETNIFSPEFRYRLQQGVRFTARMVKNRALPVKIRRMALERLPHYDRTFGFTTAKPLLKQLAKDTNDPLQRKIAEMLHDISQEGPTSLGRPLFDGSQPNGL